MNLSGASYRKVQPLLLSHPILYMCHGMDLKLRCKIIIGLHGNGLGQLPLTLFIQKKQCLLKVNCIQQHLPPK